MVVVPQSPGVGIPGVGSHVAFLDPASYTTLTSVTYSGADASG